MPTAKEKAILFHSLHVPGRPLVLFNCWDAGSAKAIVAGGAVAVATTSWAVAAAHGYLDGEHTPFAVVTDNLAQIASTVEVPVSVDLESGYGGTPEQVAASVERAIEAGAIACNLEDCDMLSGGIRGAAEQARRLHAVRAVAARLALPFFINARTDAFLQSAPNTHDAAMLDETISRARLYAENGADGLFVPGLSDSKLIERLVRASPLPVNLMIGDLTPPLATLATLGVARVSYGPVPYLQMMKSLEEAARAAVYGIS
ncbi:MAG: hypothetical protein JWQ10_2621 [Herbaspirillum sp.]|nr:hypothetical protein [Herbaspirillum sp.]